MYFAFEKPQRPLEGVRAVWALGGIDAKNREIGKAHAATKAGSAPAPTLETIRPQQDENARLVAQAGLFTKAPLGMTVDSWVQTNFAGVTDQAPLLKLVIPEPGRTECLRTLNKMNINHLTLFPDIHGSSQHCNKALEIDKY